MDKDVTLVQLETINSTESQLLWVDLQHARDEELAKVLAALRVPQEGVADIVLDSTTPSLEKLKDAFWLRVVVVSSGDGLKLQGQLLILAAGSNWVLSTMRSLWIS